MPISEREEMATNSDCGIESSCTPMKKNGASERSKRETKTFGCLSCATSTFLPLLDNFKTSRIIKYLNTLFLVSMKNIDRTRVCLFTLRYFESPY